MNISLTIITSLILMFAILFTMMYADTVIRKKTPTTFEIVGVAMSWSILWFLVHF